jgi:hypothetical protein
LRIAIIYSPSSILEILSARFFLLAAPKNGLNDLNVLNFLLYPATFPERQKFLGLHGKKHAQEKIFIALSERTEIVGSPFPIRRIGQLA